MDEPIEIPQYRYFIHVQRERVRRVLRISEQIIENPGGEHEAIHRTADESYVFVTAANEDHARAKMQRMEQKIARQTYGID